MSLTQLRVCIVWCCVEIEATPVLIALCSVHNTRPDYEVENIALLHFIAVFDFKEC